MPEVLAAHSQERFECKQAGRSDAGHKKLELFELGFCFLARLVHEALLAQHQQALGAHCQLLVQAQVAEHIDYDGPFEFFGQGLQVHTDLRRREVARIDEFNQLRVGIKAHPEPLADRLLALLEYDRKQRWQ